MIARPVAALIAALLAGGCTTMFDWHDAEGAEPKWQGAYLSPDAQFTLQNGNVRKMTAPRDFGPAVCASLGGCIAKADIVSARWYRQAGFNQASDVVQQVIVAGLFFPWTAAVLLDGATRQPPQAPPPPPNWSYIPESCSSEPSGEHPVIQDMQLAARWVEENRWFASGGCLQNLSWSGSTNLWSTSDGMIVEVETLSDIRVEWNRARCTNAERISFASVMTHRTDANDPARGPPGYLDLVTRLLLDAHTWAYEENLAEYCSYRGGALPESEWPARKVWMRALHPFPPPGFEEQFP